MRVEVERVCSWKLLEVIGRCQDPRGSADFPSRDFSFSIQPDLNAARDSVLNFMHCLTSRGLY